MGIWGCGKHIYQKDGVLGLYKGWFATMVVSKYLSNQLGYHSIHRLQDVLI